MRDNSIKNQAKLKVFLFIFNHLSLGFLLWLSMENIILGSKVANDHIFPSKYQRQFIYIIVIADVWVVYIIMFHLSATHISDGVGIKPCSNLVIANAVIQVDFFSLFIQEADAIIDVNPVPCLGCTKLLITESLAIHIFGNGLILQFAAV